MPRPSAAPSPSRWRLPDAGRKCVRLLTRERRIKSDSRLGNLIERKISTVILPKIELWLVPVQIGRKGDHSGRPQGLARCEAGIKSCAWATLLNHKIRIATDSCSRSYCGQLQGYQ